MSTTTNTTTPSAPAKAAHTPGPWELDYDKGSTRDILSRKHGGICAVRRAGRHNDETYLANARLIAAAPELLAALSHLIQRMDDNPEVRRAYLDAMPQAVELARAAIAKATGGNA